MKKSFGLKLWFCMVIPALLPFGGCIDPFEAEVEDFVSALVVEATITDENKQQETFLTRTFRLIDEGPIPESNATVVVVDDSGGSLSFEEVEPGKYRSTASFAAQPNRTYQLRITTQNGRSYTSTSVQLPGATTIDEIRAERRENDAGEDGMAILVNSFDPTGNSRNYRYTYEETFVVMPPFWTPVSLQEVPDPPLGPTDPPECGVVKVQRTREERVCYRTEFSNNIVLTDTNDLEEDRVTNFVVRFIKSDNYIISHRYSILIRQFVQSNEALSFYETLSNFSSNESLFSDTQVGFLRGNISSTTDENEKVLGYFDVASVSERRLFFNYEDFYPNEPLPPFVDPCPFTAPELRDADDNCILENIIEGNGNLVRFFDDNVREVQGPPSNFIGLEDLLGPFLVVPRICGDCTVLGTSEQPEFWVE